MPPRSTWSVVGTTVMLPIADHFSDAVSWRRKSACAR
jgi:hypothetical protein